MKLITLNIWGGRAGKEKLLGFLDKHRDADIVCLQEIWSAPYLYLDGRVAGGIKLDHDKIMTEAMQDISQLLSEHVAYFHPHHMDHYGLMMLVKKGLNVLEVGDKFVFKEKGYIPDGDIGRHARNIQYVTLDTDRGPLTVINFHGLWDSGHKNDTEERAEQSQKILDFLKGLNNEFVFCGDFNLALNTKSLTMFEDFGLRNLIREHGITSTRTSLFDREEKHADYIFLTNGINVKKFEVLPDEVSDHLPLVLEFELF